MYLYDILTYVLYRHDIYYNIIRFYNAHLEAIVFDRTRCHLSTCSSIVHEYRREKNFEKQLGPLLS